MRTALDIARDVIDTDDKIKRLSMTNVANLDEEHRAGIHAELMEARNKRFLLGEEERKFIYSVPDETEEPATGQAAGKSGE